MKKIYKFPEKSELSKFKRPVKISWLIFLGFPGRSGGEMKHLQRTEQAHCLARLATSPFDFALAVRTRGCALT